MDDPDTNGGRLQNASQQGLILSQRFLCRLELTDVGYDAGGADDPAVLASWAGPCSGSAKRLPSFRTMVYS